EIIKTTFTNKDLLLQFVFINTQDAIKLLGGTDIDGGLAKFMENSSPWNNIKAYSPNDFNRFINAKQQNNGLPFAQLNVVTKYGTLLLLLISTVLYVNADRKNKFKYLPFILFVISICLLN